MFARLVRMCKGDSSVVFMVATIGNTLQKYRESDSPTHCQLVFDAVESELTEMLADGIEESWRRHADNSCLQYSSRFSPGYCDMDLKQQHIIFNTLDAARIGVILNPYCVMSPGKSISSFAIIASEVPVQTACVFCLKSSCPWRKSRLQD